MAEILADLRKQGQLIITNDKISLKKQSRKHMDINKNEIIKKKSYIIYNYNNETHINFINNLIQCGHLISFAGFANKHILYVCIIPLKTKHDDIVIKFGYTNHIFKRRKSLISEYGSEVHFIKLKIINGEPDEQKFHKMMKRKYPELIECRIICNKKKIELYKLNPILLKEFDSYKSPETQDRINTKISDIIDAELELNCDISLDNRIMEYKILKLKYKHEETMAKINFDKEKELAKIKYPTNKKKPCKPKFIEEESPISEISSLSCDSPIESQDKHKLSLKKNNNIKKSSKKRNQKTLKL